MRRIPDGVRRVFFSFVLVRQEGRAKITWGDGMKRLKNWGPVRLGLEMMDLYNHCAVAQAAAALAYFLILTLFPLLLCVNYFIGLFRLDLEQLLLSVHQFLPQEVLAVLRDYLRYASRTQSGAVLLASLATILVSASAGIRTLLHTMDRLYGLEPGRGLKRIAESVALSVLFLLTIYLSLAVIFTGDWFFHRLGRHLPERLLAGIPLPALSGMWLGLRYVLLFCFMLLLVLLVYWMGSPPNERGWRLIFCALASAGAIVGSSVVFAWLIDMSARYSLVYGSLASLIILMVWLYICGNILLLGALVGQICRPRPCQKKRDWLK